ncbi:tRNA uridine(34) 5-carboxymethylaminomethyl modification radical SAM/GNAT enzyme Elp3 [Candidatus Micrarchaeota archaeon CG09_land_8_20_14_0_10_60_16]|nr:MAG: tRNA uridine(34) 5-carboxymethylaminomethyl modification radical SAM/GNAT enzyme Elp3 [Candidatus Micrarchaeota archaeon CG09_land_8_20_14_0_10_60_16]
MKLKQGMAKEEIEAYKRRQAKRLGFKQVAGNADLLASLPKKEREGMRETLKVRNTRSASGVCVIAVMTRPWPCPGKCAYCPTAKNAPKSYTGFEPAARRARQNNFDAYAQVEDRLRQLEAIGHEPSKCELIIMGGTFNSQPRAYQDAFIKKAYEAFNGKKSRTLAEAIKTNEKAHYRVTGLTLETRPDWCIESEVKRFVGYGATRIELGVQSLDEGVLKRVNRGHGLAAVAEATRYCKDAFLKVCYHVMPGLYATRESDLEMFRQLFGDERFKPDMLKIYPCLVIKGTRVYREWKRGEFKPYSTEEAAEVIAEAKRFVPQYCRIMRVDRDIPTNLIAAGVDKSNLREIARKKAKEKGIVCRCIRCREIGFNRNAKGKPKLARLDYEASGGAEIFLSYENGDALWAFLRLRCNESGECGVRELRVFGEQTPVGAESRRAQHKGYGARLLAEAERIARKDFKAKKLVVLAGVGARPYYRRLGYALRGGYMEKSLSQRQGIH